MTHPVEWPQRIPAGDLTAKYQQWLEANTDKKLTTTKAGREMGGVMKELGITPTISNGKRFELPERDIMKTRFANLYKTTVEDMF